MGRHFCTEIPTELDLQCSGLLARGPTVTRQQDGKRKPKEGALNEFFLHSSLRFLNVFRLLFCLLFKRENEEDGAVFHAKLWVFDLGTGMALWSTR